MVADKIAHSLGNAKREVYVKGEIDGEPCRGFLDVYDPASNTYYEIKSFLIAFSQGTKRQMIKYDNSKPVKSLFGNVKGNVKRIIILCNNGSFVTIAPPSPIVRW